MSKRPTGFGVHTILLAVAATAILLTGCPLPFEFTPATADTALTSSNDPANPSVTAAPRLVLTQSSTGVQISSASASITTNRDVDVAFSSDTPGASFFFTLDGTEPIPGQGSTRRFGSETPISLNVHGTNTPVRAIAIGPGMYPSLVTDRAVSVVYDTVATPVFTPAPGNYSTNQSVTISTATAGATIHYTVSDGTEGAPTPAPGEPGTLQYSGPIAVSGTGTAKSINAVAVKDEMADSHIASAIYTIGFEPSAPPEFAPAGGTYLADQLVTLTSAEPDGTVFYTIEYGLEVPATPVPGTPGTFEYTDPISVAGDGTVATIRAITRAPQRLDSSPVTATFTIDYPSSFAELTLAEIISLDSFMDGTSVDNSDGNRIPVGTIIVYFTGEERYGKMLVTVSDASNNHGLTFDYVTYNADGTVRATSTSVIVGGTWSFDLDLPFAAPSDGVVDFSLRNQTNTDRSFDPRDSARFYFLP